jgi:hypothetical protein
VVRDVPLAINRKLVDELGRIFGPCARRAVPYLVVIRWLMSLSLSASRCSSFLFLATVIARLCSWSELYIPAACRLYHFSSLPTSTGLFRAVAYVVLVTSPAR